MYHPGDPVSAIDWYASARLSSAQGDAAFVVRERFAEEAPRVVIVCDRRPSMGLYGQPFPWLSKPAAVAGIFVGRGAAGWPGARRAVRLLCAVQLPQDRVSS